MEREEIYQLVEEDLAKVRGQMDAVSEVDSPQLAELLRHVLGGGKAIRPVLTLLAGKFYDYNLELLLPMATAVELLHTATLVHDDAVDKSPVRRGQPTVNSIWGEDRAVLLGDYLFARAGVFTATTGNQRAITLFSRTLQIISRGELAQTFDAFHPAQSRQRYLERIANKTASLFVLATVSGAVLSRAPEASIEILREYAYNLGIAFQIVDDVLDFTSTEAEMGKPVGSDLAQGTLTLPAMLLMEQHPDDNPVRELFLNHDALSEAEKRAKIERAIEMVTQSSIIKQCYQVAEEYSALACRDLDKLPDKPSRQALKDLARLVISRQS